MTYYLLIFTSLLILVQPSLALIYRTTTGATSELTTIDYQKTKTGFELKTISPTGKVKADLLADYGAAQIHFSSDDGNSDLIIKKDNNFLVFSGKYAGKPVNRSIPVDQVPWFGSIHSLRNFITSDQNSLVFCLALPTDQTVMKCKAIKEKTETIKITGNDVAAVRVKLTFPDWRSHFWSSTYWFRKSDGLLLRSKETRGPPGTPETTMELIEE